jgi:hypothetical protein
MVGREALSHVSHKDLYRPITNYLLAVSEGLFGKITDTVNTAKDIAHVIWNVGWRSGR